LGHNKTLVDVGDAQYAIHSPNVKKCNPLKNRGVCIGKRVCYFDLRMSKARGLPIFIGDGAKGSTSTAQGIGPGGRGPFLLMPELLGMIVAAAEPAG
jgi:hypothetical protein